MGFKEMAVEQSQQQVGEMGVEADGTAGPLGRERGMWGRGQKGGVSC